MDWSQLSLFYIAVLAFFIWAKVELRSDSIITKQMLKTNQEIQKKQDTIESLKKENKDLQNRLDDLEKKYLIMVYQQYNKN